MEIRSQEKGDPRGWPNLNLLQEHLDPNRLSFLKKRRKQASTLQLRWKYPNKTDIPSEELETFPGRRQSGCSIFVFLSPQHICGDSEGSG